jgi:uracil permease
LRLKNEREEVVNQALTAKNSMATEKKLVLDVHEKPKNVFQWLALSLQHVFAMFGATVLVPILTGLDIGVALIASGIGTLIYIVSTKAKVPVYLGSSFAYIAAISIASQSFGVGSALIGLMVVGLIYILVALVIGGLPAVKSIKFKGVRGLGSGWLNKMLPPVVIGPTIAIIGISLAGVATGQAGLVPNSSDGFFALLGSNFVPPLIALVAFLATTVLAVFSKGFFKIVPILGGIVVGYLFALVLHYLGLPLFIVNGVEVPIFDFTNVSNASLFALPTFRFFGTYAVDWRAVAMFAPIAFVTIAEHIGDHKVLGSITGKDFIKDPGLHRTLLGDGVATFVAGAIGGPANTTYGENTGVVGMTKVASVWVVGTAAILSIFLGFIGYFNAAVASIPTPVMGGVLVLLFGLIAGNGMKIMIDARVNLSNIRNLIIVSTMLVIGLGGASIPLNDASSLTGMSFAVVVGIILNLLLPEGKDSYIPEEPRTDHEYAEQVRSAMQVTSAIKAVEYSSEELENHRAKIEEIVQELRTISSLEEPKDPSED